MAANTLLGYFKDALARRGVSSTKYLNREFLAIYIAERNESHKLGYAHYPRTVQTKFYNLNSTAYCEFLEVYEEYRRMMDRINARYGA